MIGRSAEKVLNRAVQYAFERRHEYFTLEHVLLSLLEETEILDIVQACNGSYTDIKKKLEEFLDKEVPPIDKTVEKSEFSIRGADGDENPDEISNHPVATLSIQRLIQRALFQVQSAGKDEISPVDLFVALFQSKDSYALHLLKRQGIERLNVLEYISHGARNENASENYRDSQNTESENHPKNEFKFEALQNFTTNLTEQARQGKLDPMVGRKSELERVIQILCRRQKNNPLLVGEAGVGKTAIAEGLAQRIVMGDIPPILEGSEIYALDMGALIAGTKFRGDFEQRLKRVLKEVKKKKDMGVHPILMIDEIHTVVGAGSVTGGHLDAANLLKPALSRGEIQCIGSTTYAEYRTHFEKDQALARRFQKIDVPEPSIDEAIRILDGLKERYESHHGVKYTTEAIRASVELSAKHMNDRFLPDKAIDIIDEVGAKSRLDRSKQNEMSKEAVIEAADIEDIVAKLARIPARSVSTSQKKRLQNLERDLKLTLFGQDHAIDALVTAIRLARSGLRTGERPVGSFLFCGPTGVGKTELSKQLAHSMGIKFLRFDMSEYMEKHTVSRLIGAPPGYVGFEQAGLLTDAVSKNPHSVVLFDEFEKAHMDVWNILLQVMDHGILTDNNGKKIDFRNTIIILTSNVGSRELERRPLGMAGKDEGESVSRKEVERTFSPEFRNRLDAIVYFNPLDPVTIAQVVGKQLLELESQLLAKGVEIEITTDAREWLAKKGYDRLLGARPMSRLIQEKIKRALSEEILFGKLEWGGKTKVSFDGQDLKFEYWPAEKKKPDAFVEQIETDDGGGSGNDE